MTQATASQRALARAIADEVLREIDRIVCGEVGRLGQQVRSEMADTRNHVLPGNCHDARRFWLKVRLGKPDTCWPWLGRTSQHGYGVFACASKCITAHRYAYLFAHGTIAEGLHVLHSCDNRHCCNAGHLRAGTAAENAIDRDSRQRTAWGLRHPHSKLNAEIVRCIRASRQSNNALARRFGISRRSVLLIRTRQSWKHIP